MPTAALRPCAEPHCPALVTSGRCPQHARPTDKGWGTHGTERIRGRKLQRLRNELFNREPLCRACRGIGRVTIATIRDHIVPLSEGGTDDFENIQPICESCHSVKVSAESLRGRERTNGD